MRRFRGNNNMKGRIQQQLPNYIESGAIQFEKGEKRNTCIITINEKMIDDYELQYMYKTLIPTNREITVAV